MRGRGPCEWHRFPRARTAGGAGRVGAGEEDNELARIHGSVTEWRHVHKMVGDLGPAQCCPTGLSAERGRSPRRALWEGLRTSPFCPAALTSPTGPGLLRGAQTWVSQAGGEGTNTGELSSGAIV